MLNGKRAFAVVGIGGMGASHVEEVDKLQNAVIAGVFDTDDERKRWAMERGFKCYADFEAVISDPDVDVVLIATPNDSHKDYAIRAMRAGKHVLCEKPVMITSKDLLDVMAVSEETGRIFYPRHNRRWDKDFLIVKKIYEENLLGKVFSVESRVLGSRGIPGDWRSKKAQGGGMMLDWGVHLLDRLLTLIPQRVTKVFTSLTYVTNDEVDDGFKMHLTFESGLTAVVEVGTCHFINLPLWYVAGDHGTAYIEDWDYGGKIVRLLSWDDRETKPIVASEGLTKTMAPRGGDSTVTLPLPDVQTNSTALYQNVIDVIDGKAEQIVTAEQALRVLRLMEAAVESSEKGVVVNFE